MRGRVMALGVIGTAAVTAASVSTSAQAAAPRALPTPTVVVSGLNNPRQLSLVYGGYELLIAEAGKGGTKKIGSGQNAEYFGATGSVSVVYLPGEVSGTNPDRIVTGLISGSSAGGLFAAGPDGVTARYPDGDIYVQETSAPPDVLPTGIPTDQNGELLTADGAGAAPEPFAAITAYEMKHDPDGQGKDSNPYAVLARPDDLLVADAAGNDVLSVTNSGAVSLFHVFPNITGGPCAHIHDPNASFPGCNFVPTAIATDKAGHVFVGGLGSEVSGAAEVIELDQTGQHVLKTYRGFHSVDGLAVGPQGQLYVSQLEATEAHPISTPFGPTVGVLTQVATNGHRTNVDVPYASGVAADPSGNVYVSAFAVLPGTGLGTAATSGQVWRFRF